MARTTHDDRSGLNISMHRSSHALWVSATGTDSCRIYAWSNPAAIAANSPVTDRSLGAIAPSEANGLEW